MALRSIGTHRDDGARDGPLVALGRALVGVVTPGVAAGALLLALAIGLAHLLG